jgi:Mce-associated membrane protein
VTSGPATSTSDDAPDTAPEPDATPRAAAGRSRRRRLRSRGRTTWLWVTGAVALATLALAVVSLLRTPSDDEVRESALLAARTYTTSLTTFDARTLDADAERVRRSSTEQFAEQYEQTIEGLRETVEGGQTVSTGTVVGAGIEELDDGTATVLVAVNQQITSQGAPPRTEANRLRMVLERRDGQWLIRSVDRL